MTENVTIKVDNGQRLQVEFGPYAGEAGVVVRGTVKRVAFFADWRSLRRIEQGAIAGELHKVLEIEKSDPDRGGVKGMVVLTVQPVAN